MAGRRVGGRFQMLNLFDSIYVRACRAASGVICLKGNRHVGGELRENLRLASLHLWPEEVVAFTYLATILAGVIAGIASLVIWFFGPRVLLTFILPLPVFACGLVGWYPQLRARGERVKAIGEATTFVSYLSMMMKVRPNLERATIFAAEHLQGPLGRDLREELMKVWMGARRGMSEVLSRFAERWGMWCGELKRSTYLILTSLNEKLEEGRLSTLNSAMEASLEGARQRTKAFTSNLNFPVFLIYSMGVLLPLVLIAVLPVLGMMNLQFGVVQLSVIYCVALPVVVYMLSKHALSARVAAFQRPEIRTEVQRGRVLGLAAGAGLIPPLAGLVFGLPGEWMSLSILWGVNIGFSIYFYLTSKNAYRKRLEVEEAELELGGALVQLGNYIKEGRPAEDAFERVSNVMKGSKLAPVFSRISANVRLGGMGLREAVFDEEKGALKGVDSDVIQGALELLVELVERSTSAAGDAILRLAHHLKELKETEVDLRRSMSEATSSMHSVAVFFAPLIAAITAQVQGALTSKTPGIFFISSGAGGISSAVFTLVLGVYTILLAMILTSFEVEIQFGGDGVTKRMKMARILPVTLGIFTLGMTMGGQIMGFLIG